MIDLSKLTNEDVKDVVRESRRPLSARDALDKYLKYEGIIGYTSAILDAWTDIQKAEVIDDTEKEKEILRKSDPEYLVYTLIGTIKGVLDGWDFDKELRIKKYLAAFEEVKDKQLRDRVAKAANF
jgi:hypothetical protein